MMPVDCVVRARIDAETKDSATKALAEMGLSISDYIRMALVRVARDKAIPFQVKVPDLPARETMGKADHEEDALKAKDETNVLRQLGI